MRTSIGQINLSRTSLDHPLELVKLRTIAGPIYSRYSQLRNRCTILESYTILDGALFLTRIPCGTKYAAPVVQMVKGTLTTIAGTEIATINVGMANSDPPILATCKLGQIPHGQTRHLARDGRRRLSVMLSSTTSLACPL